jgi:hypothetical protein
MSGDFKDQLLAIRPFVKKGGTTDPVGGLTADRLPKANPDRKSKSQKGLVFGDFCIAEGVVPLSTPQDSLPGGRKGGAGGSVGHPKQAPKKSLNTAQKSKKNPPMSEVTSEVHQSRGGGRGNKTIGRQPGPTISGTGLADLAKFAAEIERTYYGKSGRGGLSSRVAPPTPARTPERAIVDVVTRNPNPLSGGTLSVTGAVGGYLGAGWQTSLRQQGSRWQLTLGIDFGTAYTKVCIGWLRRVHAVAFFPLAAGIERFLLPGVLSIDRQGECHLGTPNAGSAVIHHYENLKLPLLEDRAGAEDQSRVIAFLALVMRYARGWLFTEWADPYGQGVIDWYVNVGLPTDTWDRASLHIAYQHIAQLAWVLSVERGAVTLSQARDLLGQKDGSTDLLRRHERGLQPGCLNVAPEFAAQVTSYTRSPQGRPDLHFLVDVGAGTIDITTFHIGTQRNTGEDVLKVLAAKVARLGTHYFIANRLPNAGVSLQWSDAERISSADVFAKRLGKDPLSVRRSDDAFAWKVSETEAGVLRHTKQHRYPNSPRWADGIPTFLTGGGAEIDIYRTALQRTGFDLRLIRMPVPNRLSEKGLDETGFGRLSVAYGLSYGIDDLGQVIAVSKVPDQKTPQPEKHDYTERYVSKDQC